MTAGAVMPALMVECFTCGRSEEARTGSALPFGWDEVQVCDAESARVPMCGYCARLDWRY